MFVCYEVAIAIRLSGEWLLTKSKPNNLQKTKLNKSTMVYTVS